MPNRRRRKLSTAMSAVAALAVASPFAVVAVTDLSADATPAPQQREFKQAALATDLPNELMSALTQGLSQFGINMPALGGAGAAAQPISAGPAGLTSPTALTGLPGATGLPSAGLPNTGLTTPGVGAVPGLDSAALANPALTPALTPGATALTPGATSLPGGLTTPQVGVNPALTSPLTTPGATSIPGLGLPNETPISAPTGLDPMAGTYPILGGDPSLGMPATGGGSGGLVSDLSSAASQLGAGQAIDLLKGVLMPMITSGIKSAATPAAAAAAPAADAAAAAVPGA